MTAHVSWAKRSHEALCKDKILGAVAKKHGPPTIPRTPDPFVMLVKSIASQQLSGRAAQTIYNRLEALAGGITPQQLAVCDAAGCRSAGLSQSKTTTILSLAHAAQAGLRLDRLTKKSDEEVTEILVQFKGIGVWTAQMFLIFGLGRPDVLSPGDLGLRKGLQKVYKLPETPTIQQSGPMFDRWKPFRSAACWYLWRANE
jgi:DNA-3-methyladenine glycosylase II